MIPHAEDRDTLKIRTIIRRFWLEEYYGPFPEGRSTPELVEWMMIGHGTARAANKMVQAAIERRNVRIKKLSSALDYLMSVYKEIERDPEWLRLLFLLDPRDVLPSAQPFKTQGEEHERPAPQDHPSDEDQQGSRGQGERPTQ